MANTSDVEAAKLKKLIEDIAVIVGKTYSERGDGFELADDEAIGRIRDLLNEHDAKIVERNRNKKLPRH